MSSGGEFALRIAGACQCDEVIGTSLPQMQMMSVYSVGETKITHQSQVKSGILDSLLFNKSRVRPIFFGFSFCSGHVDEWTGKLLTPPPARSEMGIGLDPGLSCPF